jgi:hypothetical protein
MELVIPWCLPLLGVGLFFYKRGRKEPLDLTKPCLGRNQHLVGICQGRMDRDLLEYLHATSILQMAEAELEEHGFGCCVDYRNKPGHIYYEGYFHASPLGEGIPWSGRRGVCLSKVRYYFFKLFFLESGLVIILLSVIFIIILLPYHVPSSISFFV